MNLHEETIAKISQLSEELVKEVNDFVDFLLLKEDRKKWELWQQKTKSEEIVESDYLTNLESYEESLARGEIKW